MDPNSFPANNHYSPADLTKHDLLFYTILKTWEKTTFNGFIDYLTLLLPRADTSIEKSEMELSKTWMKLANYVYSSNKTSPCYYLGTTN